MVKLKPNRDLSALRDRVQPRSQPDQASSPSSSLSSSGTPVAAATQPERSNWTAKGLMEAMVPETSDKLFHFVDGSAAQLLSQTCREMCAVTASQALWQRYCMREWGENGWRAGDGGEKVLTLGERCILQMQAEDKTVDQLTQNVLMEAELPSRSKGVSAFDQLPDESSPYDGLPFEQTVGSRVGGVGPSHIDWKATYRKLSHMRGICGIYASRAAISAPGNWRKKAKAAADCMLETSKWAQFGVLYKDPKCGDQKHILRSLPAGQGGFLPHYLMLSAEFDDVAANLPLSLFVRIPGQKQRVLAKLDKAKLQHRATTGGKAVLVLQEPGSVDVEVHSSTAPGDGGRIRSISTALSLNDICERVQQCSSFKPAGTMPGKDIPKAWIRFQLRGEGQRTPLCAATYRNMKGHRADNISRDDGPEWIFYREQKDSALTIRDGLSLCWTGQQKVKRLLWLDAVVGVEELGGSPTAARILPPSSSAPPESVDVIWQCSQLCEAQETSGYSGLSIVISDDNARVVLEVADGDGNPRVQALQCDILWSKSK